MKKRIRKGLIYIAVGFIGLFCLRLGYGYLFTGGSPSSSNINGFVADWDGRSSSALATAIGGHDTQLKSNFASEKVKVQRSAQQSSISVDQKYEKIASMRSKATGFEEDERNIRELVARHSALVQFEQASGLPGKRLLELGIGVPPANFDAMVTELKGIGELLSVQIDKKDKTNEYKDLMAKRSSLEKSRDALASLKIRAGKIEEFTDLENRLLEMEQQIQDTGVKLGDFDQENEFCTVKLTLVETTTAAAVSGPSFRHRVAVALAWTIKYYAIGLGMLFCATIIALLLVVLMQRLNLIPPPASPQFS